MIAASAEREIWQERAGAFYPLVVAAQAQSRLPLAGRLVPSEGDLKRSLVWLPAVGLGLGVLWAFIAASFVEIGVSSFATAVFVVIAVTACGGLCFERALANQLSAALGRWRRGVGQDVQGEDALLVSIAVICLAIVLRAAALAAIPSGQLTEALIGSAVLSRWVLSLGPLIVAVRSSEQDVRELFRYISVAAGVAIVMALCQGGSGLVLMILAGLAMVALARKTAEMHQSISVGLGLAMIVEIIVLLGQ